MKIGIAKQKYWRVMICCGVLGTIFVVCYWPSREPSYEGKPLSQWLRFIHITCREAEEDKRVIRAMGTNVVPFLVKRVVTKDSA